ncbi:MAG: hypothetical protein AB7R89_09005 [Dehalococcoidia bacterium]
MSFDVFAPTPIVAGESNVEQAETMLSWRSADEAAFEVHAGLPHTVRFVEGVAALIDDPLDVNRTAMMV